MATAKRDIYKGGGDIYTGAGDEVRLGALQVQIEALQGAIIYIGNIYSGTEQVTQESLDARARELGKYPPARGYVLIDSNANDWWHDGAAWINIGYYEIATATNSSKGVVQGSDADLHVAVGPDGKMKVNGLANAIENVALKGDVAGKASACAINRQTVAAKVCTGLENWAPGTALEVDLSSAFAIATPFDCACRVTANAPPGWQVPITCHVINKRWREGTGNGNQYGSQIAIGRHEHGKQNEVWYREQNLGVWAAWTPLASGSLLGNHPKAATDLKSGAVFSKSGSIYRFPANKNFTLDLSSVKFAAADVGRVYTFFIEECTTSSYYPIVKLWLYDRVVEIRFTCLCSIAVELCKVNDEGEGIFHIIGTSRGYEKRPGTPSSPYTPYDLLTLNGG